MFLEIHPYNCTQLHITLSSLDLCTDPVRVEPLLHHWMDCLSGYQCVRHVGPPPHTKQGGVGRHNTMMIFLIFVWHRLNFVEYPVKNRNL